MPAQRTTRRDARRSQHQALLDELVCLHAENAARQEETERLGDELAALRMQLEVHAALIGAPLAATARTGSAPSTAMPTRSEATATAAPTPRAARQDDGAGDPAVT